MTAEKSIGRQAVMSKAEDRVMGTYWLGRGRCWIQYCQHGSAQPSYEPNKGVQEGQAGWSDMADADSPKDTGEHRLRRPPCRTTTSSDEYIFLSALEDAPGFGSGEHLFNFSDVSTWYVATRPHDFINRKHSMQLPALEAWPARVPVALRKI